MDLKSFLALPSLGVKCLFYSPSYYSSNLPFATIGSTVVYKKHHLHKHALVYIPHTASTTERARFKLTLFSSFLSLPIPCLMKRCQVTSKWYIWSFLDVTWCTINMDNEKKSYMVSYIEAEVVDSWKALAEYSDANSTYQDFKNCLLELYNQVALRYIISDLDQLIGKHQHVGKACKIWLPSTYNLTRSLISSLQIGFCLSESSRSHTSMFLMMCYRLKWLCAYRSSTLIIILLYLMISNTSMMRQNEFFKESLV